MSSSNLLADTKVSSLKGIGEKMEKLFEKVGVTDLNQLLHFYPRAYDSYGSVCGLDELVSGEKQSVEVLITRPPVIRTGTKTTVTILTVKNDFQTLEVLWYHVPYLRKVLKRGSRFVLRGIVARRPGKWIMEHPEIFTPAQYAAIEGTVQPVYSLTAGLSNKTVQKAVRQIFEKYEIEDYLPESFLNDYALTGRERSLNNIHFPENPSALYDARRRIIFDEFLFFLLGIRKLKQSDASENHFRAGTASLAGKVTDSLPYELTGAQKQVLSEIFADIKSDRLMNRLIQGDVGSGKTIVCFLAMLTMYENGYQSALMAPTEVLAVQHYRSLCSLIEECGLDVEPPVLLTGSTTQKEKRSIYERIGSGTAKLIIGTHALFQEKADYKDLALVVTDEQHRFGVHQRSALSEKGEKPHTLVMSATPIPRTLALILYGDMKVSVIDEMPARRLRVKNAVVNTSYREKAYQFIAKEIKNGHQAFVVCPMIEKNEDFPCESVVEYAAKLKKVFGSSAKIDLLHGRMKEAEKNRIMMDFAEGKTDILVSTTVIEVGVDVPNATVMMVENADRFGLAQLHQLRGRVGRGDAQSYCIFVQSEGKDEVNERLDVLSRSNDGFFIAEEDLKLRGQGDLFGLRQSGEAGFELADVMRDRDLLQLASSAVDRITRTDPGMTSEEYRKLGMILEEHYGDLNVTL